MRTLEMDYGHGDQVASHCHAEDQLIYAASGVMRVSSAGGDWVIPGGHALWVPAGVSHAIRMQGVVSMRTLLLDAGIACHACSTGVTASMRGH